MWMNHGSEVQVVSLIDKLVWGVWRFNFNATFSLWSWGPGNLTAQLYPHLLLLGDGLTKTEIITVAESLLKEADIDQDGKLSYTEFEHVISRAPDFVNLFRMSLT